MGWHPLEQHTPLGPLLDITSALSSSPGRTGRLLAHHSLPSLTLQLPILSSLLLLCPLQAHSFLDQFVPPPPTPTPPLPSPGEANRRALLAGRRQEESCKYTAASPAPHIPTPTGLTTGWRLAATAQTPPPSTGLGNEYNLVISLSSAMQKSHFKSRLLLPRGPQEDLNPGVIQRDQCMAEFMLVGCA